MTRRAFPRRAAIGALGLAVLLAAAYGLFEADRRRPSRQADLLERKWKAALDAATPDVESALALQAQALALREKLLGGQPLLLAAYLDDTAVALADRCSPAPEIQQRAQQLLERALALRERGGAAALGKKAETLENLAALSSIAGDFEGAERYARQALAVYEAQPPSDGTVLVGALSTLGYYLVDQGKYAEASRLYRQALATLQRMRPPDPFELADLYNELGELYRVQNRYRDAESSLQKARAYALKLPGENDLFLAKVDNNLAGLYKDQAEYDQAERRLRRSLALRQRSPATCSIDLAKAHLNLGEIYRLQNEPEEAEPQYERALELAVEGLGPNHPELATFYSQHAVFYTEQARYPEAREYYAEALRLTRGSLGEDHPQVAQSLHDLAGLETETGACTKAEPLYVRALAIREKAFGPKHPDVAWTLTDLARCRSQLGRIQDAAESLDRAILLFAGTTAYPDVEAEAYELRAELRKRSGDSQGATADLRRSLEIVEQMRPRTGGGEQARARFLARYLDAFHRMIEWEVEAQRPEQAFEYAERARARVLVDQLLAARLDFLASIPDPAARRAFAERRASLAARLAEVQRRIAVLQKAGPVKGRRAEALSSLFGQRDEIDGDLQEIEDRIRSESPLWQVAAQTSPVSLSTSRSELVPTDGALLLYEIGSAGSFLFVIPLEPQPVGIHVLQLSRALADRLGVEPGPLTRSKLSRILLGSSAPNSGEGRSLLALLGRRPSRQDAGREQALASSLSALRLALVPDEVWRQVQGSSEIIVIPGGPLHQLPVEALVVAPGERGFEDTRFWIDEGPPVRYAPSATALYQLRNRSRTSDKNLAAGASILSVSDPVFDRSSRGRGASDVAPAVRERYVRAGGKLERLPATALETQALLSIFGGAASGGDVLPLQGLAAEEARVRASLPGKRYVHLATHGLVDEHRGGLFAAIALTPPAPGAAAGNDDGFLQLYEIYPMKLDGELAVLSTCRSQVGPQIEGEGVFALSRGFLVAGMDRVVASLWTVADKATAALMGDFFRRLAQDERQGRHPAYAAALAQAKRALRREGLWRDPYFWAPFVLSGED